MNRVSRPDNSLLPRTIAVAGGRSGVGTTSISVNLAIALAQQGQRTVLIDADLARAEAASACGVAPFCSIADVLAGRRTIHEVLERGPGGIQLVAGADSSQCRSLCSERAIGRLIDQIRALGRHTDAVVMDLGSNPTDLLIRLWQSANRVLVTTTPDRAAVMDAYALVKSVEPLPSGPQLALVVNRADSDSQGREIHDRMNRSVGRFLALKLEFSGCLPDPRVPLGAGPAPWMLQQPLPSVAGAIERMAGQLLSAPDVGVQEAA